MFRVFLVVLALVTALPVAAHAPSKTRVPDAPPDTGTLAPIADEPAEEPTEHAGDAMVTGENEEAPFVMPPMMKAMTDHLHNKLVHFPIALGLAALLFVLLARGRPELESAASWLIWLAAASAVATYFTGRAQEESFENDAKKWVVELHEKLGTATTLSLAAWSVMSVWKRAKRFVLPWGFVIAALVLAASFFGGLAAHGH